jgi:hypothetical protein
MEALLEDKGLGLLKPKGSKSEGRKTPDGRITPLEGERKGNASALDESPVKEGEIEGSQGTS